MPTPHVCASSGRAPVRHPCLVRELLLKSLLTLGFLVLAATSACAGRDGPPSHDCRTGGRARARPICLATKSPSTGPLLLTIDLTAQRVMVYRDGCAHCRVDDLDRQHGTRNPTGVFTILEKQVMHRSTTYDDAPMPYMQRLTSKGSRDRWRRSAGLSRVAWLHPLAE